MSWFNAKAFAAGALGELSKQIDINTEEAKVYEEEQRELAKSSRRTISQRRSVVNTLVSEAKRLQSMGASKAQIQAAHSSGAGGLMALSKAMQAAMKQAGGKEKFSEFDVKAMIDSSAMSPEFKDMDYEEFISLSMGLGDQGAPEVDAERNLLQRAFGFGDKAAVRARLDREMQGDGMSLLDINAAANNAAYQSAMPGAFATFSPGEFYNAEDALKHYTLAMGRMESVLKKDTEYGRLLANDPTAAIEYRRARIGAFAATQFKRYGKDALNDPNIDYHSALGPELFTSLAMQFDLSDKITNTAVTQVSDATNVITLGIGARLTTDKAGNVVSINLSSKDQNRVITDPEMIRRTLDGFEKDGYMTRNNSPQNLGLTSDMQEERFDGIPLANVLLSDAGAQEQPEGMPLGDSGTDVARIEAEKADALALPEAAIPEAAIPEAAIPEAVEEIDESDMIGPPEAEDYKINGVTYDEWLGMNVGERAMKKLPRSTLGGEIQFKRFQLGLGFDTAKNQSAATYDSEGDAIMDSDRIKLGTVITIAGELYRMDSTMFRGKPTKYLNTLDGKMNDRDMKNEVVENTARKFETYYNKKVKDENLDESSVGGVLSALDEFYEANSTPSEVMELMNDRIKRFTDTIAPTSLNPLVGNMLERAQEGQ